MDTVEPGNEIQGSDSSNRAPIATGPAQEIELEPRSRRISFMVLALTVTGGVWFFLSSFLAPAPGRPGIDENAYLVGGRMIAQHGSPGFKPTDDYQFVGAMWVRTKSGWYYPKYPFGLPLLNAIPVLLGHVDWAFSIPPICTSLAVLGMFFIARAIVGSFYGLLAMLVLAMGPTTLYLANLPNSHAPALCFVVWGMFFLFTWWRSGKWPAGVAAGLLLGSAVTIRYTEALLLFPLYSLKVVRADNFIGPRLLPILKVLAFLPLGPIGIAALSRVRWKNWRSYVSAAVPIIAWAVPVATLVIFNWCTIGGATGYDDTNESRGFSIDHFVEKWDFTIYQLYMFGAFLFAPLGIAGFVLMFRGARRAALLLTLWFVPGTLLYTAYYWGAGLPDVAFLRFFLTLLPPLIIAAMWTLRQAQDGALRSTGQEGKGSVVSPLAAGILTAAMVAVGAWTSLGDLERMHRGNLNLQYSANRILSRVKASRGRPMILADNGMFPQLLQYMQFMFDADWYPSDIFAPKAGGGFGIVGVFQQVHNSDSNSPVVLQRERMQYIDSVRKGKTDPDFVNDLHRLMDQALADDRKVFVVIPPLECEPFRRRYISSAYEMIELERWTEPCSVTFPKWGEHSSLGLPIWNDDNFAPWHAQYRGMYEIRRAPTTQPATAPSS